MRHPTKSKLFLRTPPTQSPIRDDSFCPTRVSSRSHPAGGLHGHLVLLGEAGEHLGLEASREGYEGQEAEDDHGELPAEVEGDDEGHTDVGQRVDDHADLGARGLGHGAEQRVLFFLLSNKIKDI